MDEEEYAIPLAREYIHILKPALAPTDGVTLTESDMLKGCFKERLRKVASEPDR